MLAIPPGKVDYDINTYVRLLPPRSDCTPVAAANVMSNPHPHLWRAPSAPKQLTATLDSSPYFPRTSTASAVIYMPLSMSFDSNGGLGVDPA